MIIETEAYPELAALPLDAALALSRRIRAVVRPGLLGRLARIAVKDTARPALEASVAQLDTYAASLDQRILQESPPAPVQLRQPVYQVVRRDGERRIDADSDLFFSAESLTNVHGPVMLLHFAAVAMELARPGEAITGLRKVAFKKLVTRPLRLTVFDAAHALAPDLADLMESASVVGRFTMNSGRTLAFFGVQQAGAIAEFAHFNTCALQLLSAGLASTEEDGVYSLPLSGRIDASALPAGGFTPALAMMTMLDLWMLMFLALPFAFRTKLLLGFQELEAPDDPLHQLAASTALQCRPDFERARALGSGMMMLPAGFRLLPHDTAWRRAHIALGMEPYYRVLATV